MKTQLFVGSFFFKFAVSILAIQILSLNKIGQGVLLTFWQDTATQFHIWAAIHSPLPAPQPQSCVGTCNAATPIGIFEWWYGPSTQHPKTWRKKSCHILLAFPFSHLSFSLHWFPLGFLVSCQFVTNQMNQLFLWNELTYCVQQVQQSEFPQWLTSVRKKLSHPASVKITISIQHRRTVRCCNSCAHRLANSCELQHQQASKRLFFKCTPTSAQ